LPANYRPIPVELVKRGDKYELLRDGKPYFVKGAGWVDADLQELKRLGCNSIRVWGVDKNTGPLLDKAQAAGMTVMLGLWMLHESSFNVATDEPYPASAFDYTDPVQVAKQKADIRNQVLAFRNHPALLIWGVGNEVLLNSIHHRDVLAATEDLAKMIKQIDPSHPTSAVMCRLNPTQLAMLNRDCPNIDIWGFNGYREMASLPSRLADFGWKKPFIVTEFGAAGPWEVDQSPWGAPLEPSSTENAQLYAQTYQQLIANNPLCVGSYTFLWSDSQKGMLPWHNLALPGGVLLGSALVMQHAWTGAPPANQAPQLPDHPITLSYAGSTLHPRWAEYPPGAMIECQLAATDPDGDPLTVEWKLVPDHVAQEEMFPPAVATATGSRVTLTLPKDAHSKTYRLFATVRDNHQHAALCSVALRTSAWYNPR
jgi:hypothetical protein